MTPLPLEMWFIGKGIQHGRANHTPRGYSGDAKRLRYHRSDCSKIFPIKGTLRYFITLEMSGVHCWKPVPIKGYKSLIPTLLSLSLQLLLSIEEQLSDPFPMSYIYSLDHIMVTVRKSKIPLCSIPRSGAWKTLLSVENRKHCVLKTKNKTYK